MGASSHSVFIGCMISIASQQRSYCEFYVSVAQSYGTHHVWNVGRRVHQCFGFQRRGTHPCVYEFVIVRDLGPFGPWLDLEDYAPRSAVIGVDIENLLDLRGQHKRITCMISHVCGLVQRGWIFLLCPPILRTTIPMHCVKGTVKSQLRFVCSHAEAWKYLNEHGLFCAYVQSSVVGNQY